MNISILVEDVVNTVGLTLTFTIVASFLEFTIAGRVSFISLILGLILASTITYNIRKHYLMLRGKACTSKLALILALLYASIIVSTYYVYPIFPANRSGDFLVYIERSIVFTSGKATFKNLITLHPAIYLLLATVISLNILNLLFLTRGFMLILTILNIPLIYIVSKRIYGKSTGKIALLLSIFTNIFWYYTVIITGLYANFLGLMLALYLLYLITEYFRSKWKTFLILAIPVALTMLLSHETTFAVLTALWLSSIYEVFARRKLELLKVSTVISSPLLAVVLIAPASLKFLENFIVNYILKFKTMTLKVLLITPVNPIFNTLKTISPILAYIFSTTGLSALTLTLISLAYGTLAILRREKGLKLTLWFWILTLLAISYFTMEAWRLALNALTPVTITSSHIIGNISLKTLKTINSAKLLGKIKKALKLELLALAIIVLLISSNITLTLLYNYSRIREMHEQQYSIMEAMEWIKKNTPPNAKIVSIARWQFMYIPYLADREFIGDYALTPKQLSEDVLQNISDPIYVVVWNKIHNETTYYTSLYESNVFFRKIWANNVVSIFIYSL